MVTIKMHFRNYEILPILNKMIFMKVNLIIRKKVYGVREARPLDLRITRNAMRPTR